MSRIWDMLWLNIPLATSCALEAPPGVCVALGAPPAIKAGATAPSEWRCRGMWQLCLPTSLGFQCTVPSGYVKIATENGPSIVDSPIINGDFPWLCYFTGG